MALIDELRRQLLGQAAMMRPGQGYGGATQGLLGTGGRFGGGGLLQTRMNQPGGLLGGNIPELALLGSALYGQGIQGKDPFEGLFPAYTQAAQLKAALTPAKENLMTAYDPKTGRKVFATRTEIEQRGLEPVPETQTSSLSKEALELYKQGQAAGKNFQTWFDNLNEAEQDLYKKEVKPNESNIEKFIELVGKKEKEALEKAIPIPMKNGEIDLNSLNENVLYNFNNQLLVWNGEKLVPFPLKK